jgi:hypothetical protein
MRHEQLPPQLLHTACHIIKSALSNQQRAMPVESEGSPLNARSCGLVYGLYCLLPLLPGRSLPRGKNTERMTWLALDISRFRLPGELIELELASWSLRLGV